MEANTILKSDLLDLVFEGRNKAYGAYELRRQYNTRMRTALLITGGFGIAIFLSSFLLKPAEEKVKPVVKAVELADIEIPEKPLPPVEPPKPKEIMQVKTQQYVTPKIEPDQLVKKEDMPPEVEDLNSALIGTQTKDGVEPDGTVTAPAENTAVVEAPKTAEEGTPFVKVEVDAEFPGGNQAWFKYISREINRNMDALQDDGRSGTVVVQFVVDKEGAVSEVSIVSCQEAGVVNCIGPNSKLAEIALAAIRRGPNWKPAIQNGRNVKAYRRQPITFRLSEES